MSLKDKFKCGYCKRIVDETADSENSTDLNNIQESVCDKENEIPEDIAQKDSEQLELEYRRTVTSSKKSICEMQGSSLNTVSIPSTSKNNNDNFVDILTPVINDNNSTISSPISSTLPKKRRRIHLDEEVHENEYDITSESNSISTNVASKNKSKKRIQYIRKLLLISKVNEWKKSRLSWRKEMQRTQLIKTLLLYHFLKKKEKKKENRKFWVRSIFTEESRHNQGDSENLINKMAIDDSAKYFEYLRMNKESFNKLLQLIESRITKQHFIRTPISAATRLQICLRYLASGDTMHSISFAFRVGLNTVSKIVAETCEVIWDVLKEKVFPELTEDLWIQKAREFELLWDFPNCIGAIDGKHVQIQAPPKSGSTFYNYKGTHSIVLMALADANCRFTVVDIGAEGRRSDGGIFQNTELKRLLEEKCLNIPKARLISNKGPILPYVIIGDEAFALTSNMLCPYSRKGNLNLNKKVFNYRLCRARRTVESAFGILSSKWRIFRRPIVTTVSNAVSIVKATICLHNFLMINDFALPIEDRMYSNFCSSYTNESFQNLQISVIEDNSFRRGSVVRDLFMEYFCTHGAIEYQWEKAMRNNF